MKRNKVQIAKQDRIFYAIAFVVLLFLLVITGYPILYILSSAFSSRQAVISGRVFLFPVDFSLEGFEAVFEQKDVLIGYRNTIIYTVGGTLINVVITMLAAYAFSRKDWPMKNFMVMIFMFTMIFSGGMVPSYLLMRDLKLLNTPWAMLLPGALSIYNMTIARTFIQNNIPYELFEAARIDGCDDFRYFTHLVLPLSKAILAVLSLYYAVGHWNAYFNALIYLNNRNLYPLQVFLREILILNEFDNEAIIDEELMMVKQGMADLLRYALIVVSTAPILCMYPFVQRYFVKGVMIGSVKG
ncbi:MAG: carbohydrate ABC transporter permease [Clostridiales bacterium]|nr:carbohydrate ABC transporter permease [Clostridiales bacterium]